tara:strand:+ start:1086 stop:1298 length:213 start_codon:yes stop_codon:yes gene_type:complete
MPEVAPKSFTLSADEMALVLNMITVVAKRGAFQPSEFKLVGEFFDKYAPKQPDEEEKTPEVPATEPPAKK